MTKIERANERRFKDLSEEMQRDILKTKTLSKREKNKILKKQLIEKLEKELGGIN